MAVDVLLGLQWGDEGKGKIVDVLAPRYQVVARFQGGPNAGHTLEFDGFKHVLHQIPSGIFRQEVQNIIGNGVVLDPIIFKKEIDGLAHFNLDLRKNLEISKKASIILPTHRLLDAAYEKAKGDAKIGSTLKGIGPTYTDKISRQGLRVGDMISPNFPEKYKALVDRHKAILDVYKFEYDLAEAEKEFFAAVEFMKEFQLVDSEYVVNHALNAGKTILAEGAQGSLLDVDFGSYPFVTSSNTITAGACTGLGVAPKNIGEVFGIFKAYATRVGSGPFPTELEDEVGERMRQEGREFGSTTGRPRRCGWIDIVALKRAVAINGISGLCITKLDILDGMPSLKMCIAYKYHGKQTEYSPLDEAGWDECEPVYLEFPGWTETTAGITEWDKLPPAARAYLRSLDEAAGKVRGLTPSGSPKHSFNLFGGFSINIKV